MNNHNRNNTHLFKQCVHELFDLDNRKKKDNATSYNFFEAYFYFPKRKSFPQEEGIHSSAESKSAFDKHAKITFTLEVILYWVGLDFILRPLQTFARLLLELPLLMAEKILKNYRDTLSQNDVFLKRLMSVLMGLIMGPRLLFRCVIAPLDSLKEAWGTKLPTIIRILLCVISFIVSLTAYAILSVACLGAPLAALLKGKASVVVTNIVSHAINMLTLAHVPAELCELAVGVRAAKVTIAAARLLSKTIAFLKEAQTFFSHKALHDKSLLRTIINAIGSILPKKVPEPPAYIAPQAAPIAANKPPAAHKTKKPHRVARLSTALLKYRIMGKKRADKKVHAAHLRSSISLFEKRSRGEEPAIPQTLETTGLFKLPKAPNPLPPAPKTQPTP